MIIPFMKFKPDIDDSCFVADNASVIGKVEIGKNSSVWFGAVLRGDINSIKIGKNSNIQDNAVVHTGLTTPAVIGDGVTIGHSAVVHGAKIEDDVLVGMGAVVLDGAVVGEGSIIGAGAVVTEGTVIPKRSLVIGTPGKVVKEIGATQFAGNKMNATSYATLAKAYKKAQD